MAALACLTPPEETGSPSRVFVMQAQALLPGGGCVLEAYRRGSYVGVKDNEPAGLLTAGAGALSPTRCK